MIIAIDRVQSRLDLAQEVGATHTINTSHSDFSTLDNAVRSIVATGASIAIETTGVASIIEQSIQSTCARGKIVYIGIPPPNYSLNISLSEHMNVRLDHSTWPSGLLVFSNRKRYYRKADLSLDASKETAIPKS